jgi:hypothetical protein
MLTKHGICYDLSESPFVCSTAHFEYRFSSANHMRKFADNVQQRKDWLNDSLSRRFHVSIEVDILAELQLYMQTETRGFHVTDERGRTWRSAENMLLSGLKANGEGWREP